MSDTWTEKAKALVNRVNEGYSDETFVSDGYGYFDDMVKAIAESFQKYETEIERLHGVIITAGGVVRDLALPNYMRK